MRKQYSLMLVLGLFFLLLVAACSQEAPGSGETQDDAAGEETQEDSGEVKEESSDQKTFAFVFKSTGNPYGEKMMVGYEEVIEEKGGEVILRSPDQPTAEGQIGIIEQLITQQVDAITIAANDENALAAVLKKPL